MPILDRRRLLASTSGVLALSALGRTAIADTDNGVGNWPKDRIIRAVVPFGAGSTIDIIGRIVIDPLAQQLSQTIITENRGADGGSIGAADVAKTAADGYTLLVNAAAHTAAPAVYPNLSYDPSKDFDG